MDLLKELIKAIVDGDRVAARELAKQAINFGLTPELIFSEGVGKGVALVSERYSRYEVWLDDVERAAKAVEAVREVLDPLMKGRRPIGRVAIGVIEGDIHDIGKNLVSQLLSGVGFEVFDLGRDVPIERFIDEALRRDVDIIALSTMMTTTMPNMRKLIQTLKKRGLRARFKVLIGGGPVTQEFADKIGADGYGKDGYEAIKKARELIEQRRRC